MYLLIYLGMGLLMVYPIYLYSLRRNRKESKQWWIAKEYLAILTIPKAVVWPIYVILYLIILLRVKAERSLEAELGTIPVTDPKALALGRIEDTFVKLEYERALLEAKGWNPWNLLKINDMAQMYYDKYHKELYRAGWTEQEIFDMFDKYVPNTRTARLLKLKEK